MSDTPRTDAAEIEGYPFSYVDAEFPRYLERELAEAKEQLRLCNIDQFTTAAELAEATVKNSLTVQRPWVGLTDDEITQNNRESLVDLQAWKEAVSWAEAKLREKNT